jgi:hypothetical protein
MLPRRTLLAGLSMVVTAAEAIAQLQPPTRPTSFPLSRPQDFGKVVSWRTNLTSQPNVSGVVQVAAGGHPWSSFNLLLKSDGTVLVSPLSGDEPPRPPTGLSNVVQVAAGGYHCVALLADGSAVSWGTATNAFIPTSTAGIVQIAAAGNYSQGYTAALFSDGRVKAWGRMDEIPLDTSSWTNIIQIAAGSWRLVGLRANGTVVELGMYLSHDPNWLSLLPAGLSNVVQVAAGGIHALALKRDGTVVGWGDTNSYSGAPATVPQGLTGVKAISAAGWAHIGSHSLALKSDGTVIAWGYNFYGQTNVPTSLTNVIRISAASQHSTAIFEAPEITCSWSNSGFPYTSTDMPRVDAGSGQPTRLGIHNRGSRPLNIQSVSASPAAGFVVHGETPKSVATNGTAFFSIYATDTSVWGTRTGSITIVSDDPSGALSIPIASRTVLQSGSNGAVPGSVTNFGTHWGWYLADTTLPDGSVAEAVRTGPTPHSGESVLGGRFEGPGLLTWQWKTSTEAGSDGLVCEVNGEEVAALSATNAQWKSQVIQLSDNAARIRWIYRKNGGGSFGEDAGYVASVAFHKFTNNQVSFNDWSNSFADTDRLPSNQLPMIAFWAGGLDPIEGSARDYYRPFMTHGRLGFRYLVSKSASALTTAEISTNLIEWSSVDIEHRLIDQDDDTAKIEVLSAPASKSFFRLKITH